MNALVVGCGGFIGAVSRYLLSTYINRLISSSLPVATLVINILGSFLIGLIAQQLPLLFPNNKRLPLFLTTGILGGFTTFSAFSMETVNLYQNGYTAYAVLNVVLSITFCIAGTILGKFLAKVIVNL